MISLKKIFGVAVAGLLLAVSVPVGANASRVTRIAHPSSDYTFNIKSLYYNRPAKGKRLFYHEPNQVQAMSDHQIGTAKPAHVTPYLKTYNHGTLWYKFYKPATKASRFTLRAWIPAYGLDRYPVRRHVSKHPVHVTKRHGVRKPARHAVKHNVRASYVVRRDLALAKISRRYQNGDLKHAKVAGKYVHNDVAAAKKYARHASKAQRSTDYRLINAFLRA